MNPALALMAGLVIEDGRRWGEAAHDFQWADAEAVLDPDSATPYHFLTRSRGSSKTADLAGMAVAAMLAQLEDRSRLYALAADSDQGRLVVDSIAGFSARTPELANALKLDTYRATATRGGSVLDVLAADAPGSWGIRPKLLIVDELCQWADTPAPLRLWESATSSVAKVAGARLAVCTTAGDPGGWAAKVLEHALADPLWRVHEVEGPPPWMDEERLAEQRRRLPESVYLRLFENRWVTAEDRLVSANDLRACVTLDGPLDPQPGRRYVIGLDIGLKNDATIAAVCHREAGTVVLDRLASWQGTRARPVSLGEVEAWLEQAAKAYHGATIVADPWQATGLLQRLRARSLKTDEYTFSAQSVGRLASTLHLLLREHSLALPDDETLLDELAHVRLREVSPGVLRLDHDSGRHDDRAIALALAAFRLIEKPQAAPMRVSRPQTRLPAHQNRPIPSGLVLT